MSVIQKDGHYNYVGDMKPDILSLCFAYVTCRSLHHELG